jgi:hypothetical protein
VYFCRGGSRSYLLIHRSAKGNQNAHTSAASHVLSLNNEQAAASGPYAAWLPSDDPRETGEPLGLSGDLRDPARVRDCIESLERFPPELLDALIDGTPIWYLDANGRLTPEGAAWQRRELAEMNAKIIAAQQGQTAPAPRPTTEPKSRPRRKG